MCSKCHLFFDWIAIHLHNNHQLSRKSNELELQTIKSKTLTEHFLEDFNRKKEPDSKDIKKKSKESANHDNLDNYDKPNPNTQNLQEKQKKTDKSKAANKEKNN